MLKKLALAALFAAIPAASQAWFDLGHKVVCEIAQKQFTQKTKEALKDILKGGDFPSSCVWPDLRKGRGDPLAHTAVWHFLNLEDGENYFVKDHINKQGDVVQALLLCASKLADPNLPLNEKKIYLSFLGHLTGDIHQPLHAGHGSDLGGNKIAVTWFGARQQTADIKESHGQNPALCTQHGEVFDSGLGECLYTRKSTMNMNLHGVWDGFLFDRFISITPELEKIPSNDPLLYKAYATYLLAHVDQPQNWQYKTFWDWAQESIALSRAAYDLSKDLRHGGAVYSLGKDYYQRNIGAAHKQLVVAGLRLGQTLNRIFDKAFDDSASATSFDTEQDKLKSRLLELVPVLEL